MPSLRHEQDCDLIESLLSSLKGIQAIRMEPIIQTVLIQYDLEEISQKQLLQCMSFYFKQQPSRSTYPIIGQATPKIRGAVFRSFVAGVLLLFAYLQNSSFKEPTPIVYSAIIATGYAVLSHGTHNKLGHPDVLTGILSLGSLGPANMLHGAMATWAVNVLELLHEMKDDRTVYPI